MTRICVAIGGILISLCPAIASQLKVTVVDQKNQGVLSDVLYFDGRNPPPSTMTNNNGLAEISGVCQKISGFEAHPHESGVYFNSPLVPCAKVVVIHLLTRHAPFGVALKSLQITTTLADGSPGVVAFKAGIQSESKDIGTNSCQFSVRTVVDRQVYRVVGSAWSEASQTDAANITAETLSERLPNGTMSLPTTCNAARQRIGTLKTSAEKQVIRDFGSGFQSTTH